MAAETVRREVRSSAELQEVCLQTLKKCPGFERVDAIVIQPRADIDGVPNWTVAAVRPRVGNEFLRGARQAICLLQQTYQLNPVEVQARAKRRG